MALFRSLTLSCALFFSASCIAQSPLDNRHILYLTSIGQVNKAIDEYLTMVENEQRHDFEILTQMAKILIQNGSNSEDMEEQIFALYGVSLAGNPSLTFLENAIRSPFPSVQAVALQLLGQHNDDHASEIIALGLKSDYLHIRFEALHYLIQRKSKIALGQTESLANLLPSQFRPIFVEFFAAYNSNESIRHLKHLFSDKDINVRLATILVSANYGRDDLLPNIRSALTHPDPVLKEAAACALGILRDLSSEDLLHLAARSPFEETKLAASLALHRLGHANAKDEILKLAGKGNVFALTVCGDLPQSIDILKKHASSSDSLIRFNANLALLNLRNVAAIPFIKEILSADTKFIGFAPFTSAGRSLSAWKYVSPALLPVKESKENLQAISYSLQEEILQKCLDLPEDAFLEIAEHILVNKQQHLIPSLVRHLENLGTPKAVAYLNQKANQVGSPFTRAYCQLALYRMGENPANRALFLSWLARQKMPQLIEFMPMLDRGAREDKNVSNYVLNPKETTALLIESFDALATKHDLEGISLILKAMKEGHEKNRFTLAGLLLKSLQ